MQNTQRKERLPKVQRVVVKVGTGVVTRSDGRLALTRAAHLMEQVHQLRSQGIEVLLVSSGAVGIGRERLNLPHRPTSVVDRQACAAAGQGALMAFYDELCERLGFSVAQVLLTEADFHSRRRYVNLAATLQRLLELGALPIINENDTVSTAEIELTGPTVFGDNDRLSALLAANLGADLLVILSDVDGVYNAPPSQENAARIPIYAGDAVIFGERSAGGRGGMQAKIEAATVAAHSGVNVVIASGFEPNPLTQIVAGEDRGTWFPAQNTLNKRRQWLAYATAPSGILVINQGAKEALIERQASLLPKGITEVRHHFAAGSVVSIRDTHEQEIARGICRLGSEEIPLKINEEGKGKALVHRDQLVILMEE